MPDAFHSARVASVPGEPLWHIREGGPAGRFIGSVSEYGGGWEASLVAAGALRTKRFPDRDAAARWLASIAPRHGR